MKGYQFQLRVFISMKYLTANIIDRNNHKLVAEASTVEHALKRAFVLGRTTNATAGTVVGEVLARRLKIEGLTHRQELERGIHADVQKDIFEKKGVENIKDNSKIVWAVINSLRSNGVNVIVDDDCSEDSTV